MIKMRIESVKKEEQIKLSDCEPKDVVRLGDGSICLVVRDKDGVVYDRFRSMGLTMVSLTEGGAKVGCCMQPVDIMGASDGQGNLRIVEKLGKLRIDGV